jgi:UDP-N-acetyl-D-glucosamine dehydrogenase
MKKIKKSFIKKTVGIIGLGYVGLPLLQLISKKTQYSVLGFDMDSFKIKSLKKNKSYITDITDYELKKINKQNLFSDFKKNNVSKCDWLIFCLPTPLKNNKPDMQYIKKAFNQVYPHLRYNQTIILESTVYPGATRDIFEKKINKKFELGKNFFLCYSPERINPGSSSNIATKIKFEDITKVLSGLTVNCLKSIKNLYGKFFSKIFIAESLEIAEIAKLYENTFRSINISFANEFKMLCKKTKINFHKVLDVCSTKPFGFKRFNPGPGMGGHCIPIDPIFLDWFAKKNKVSSKFISLSHKVNEKVTVWVFKQILESLKKIKKKKKKVLILGIAYKKNINDTRESPGIKIFSNLSKIKNLDIDYQDKFVLNTIINKKLIKSRILNYKNLSNYDLIILMTDHSYFNSSKIVQYSKKIIDCRGLLKSYSYDSKIKFV